MAKYAKAVQKRFMEQEIEQDPGILEARHVIKTCMIVWVAIRILLQIVDIIGASQGMWEFYSANLSGMAVMFVFAYGAYAGEKPCAILPILGGAAMLMQWIYYGYFILLISNEFYMIARVYSLLFLVASGVQIGAFLYISLSQRTNLLFAAYKRSVAAAKEDWKLTHTK